MDWNVLRYEPQKIVSSVASSLAVAVFAASSHTLRGDVLHPSTTSVCSWERYSVSIIRCYDQILHCIKRRNIRCVGRWQDFLELCIIVPIYLLYLDRLPTFLLANIISARQHICLARYMLSPVRLSLRWVDHGKTVEVRIMKFSPYGSTITLVFAG